MTEGRRDKGTGSVRWVEARNRWEIRVTVRDAFGRPRRVARFVAAKNNKTGQRAAEKALDALVADLSAAQARDEIEVAAPRHRITLARYAGTDDGWDAWLTANTVTDEHPDRRLRPRTADEYRIVARSRLLPVLGHLPVSEIRPSDADRLVAELAARGLAAATVRRTVAVLRSVLTAAERDGIVPRGRAREIDLPSGAMRKDKTVPSATPEQMRALLATTATTAAVDPVSLALHLATALGCRRSEALALRWSDVLWAEGRLRIERGLTERQDGTLVIGETKSRNSRREVTVPAATLALLREARKSRPETTYVAEGLRTPGSPTRPSQAARAAVPLLRAAGVRGGWHAVRHGWIEAALASGAEPLAVARAAGHTPEVMLAVYAGRQQQMVDALGERMAEVLRFDAAG